MTVHEFVSGKYKCETLLVIWAGSSRKDDN